MSKPPQLNAKVPIHPGIPGAFPITSATMAKRQFDGDGKRVFGPFRVHLDVQMSPLSVSSDTLVFHVYQQVPDNVMKIVTNVMLNRFYRQRLGLEGGWPKPAGEGRLEVITDRDYELTLQQAESAGHRIFTIGDPEDPTAFHVEPKSRIIVPQGFTT